MELPPDELVDAAREIQHWFESRGIREWELGGIKNRVSPIRWEDAERIVDSKIIDFYLSNFADSPNHDNAVALVQRIQEETIKCHK